MAPLWKLSVLALCLAAPLSGAAKEQPGDGYLVERQDVVQTPGIYNTTTTAPADTTTSELPVDVSTTSTETSTTSDEVVPPPETSTTQTETTSSEILVETSETSTDIPVDTTTSTTATSEALVDATTTTEALPETTTSTDVLVDTTTTDLPVDTTSTGVSEGTTTTTEAPVDTTTTTEAQEETSETSTESTIEPPVETTTTSTEIPAETTTTSEAPVETTETSETSEEAPETTTQPGETTEDSGPTTEVKDETTTENPGQTSDVRSTTAAQETTAGPDVVTGDDGAIATFVPQQDPEYSDLTSTTTTTDDDGGPLVIFPGGWFWKPSGPDLPNILPPAPTNPPVGGGGGGGGGGEDEGEGEEEDKDKTTDKEESTQESTAESTAESTTESTTETSTEACTATEVPDCTRTISYISVDGTQVATEFGDCPTVASCATATQATATTTISPDFPWVGDFEYEEDESIAEDAETAPVEDQTDEFYEEEFDELGYDDTDNSTDTATTETATSTDTAASSDTATSETETTTDTATSETSTETEETTTTETSEFTSTPSTLITTTRSSEQSSDTTTDMITSTETTAPATTTEATRTYFPCVVRAGPNVPDPYCQCETTVEGKHYVVSTSLVSNACDSYTEFPSTVNPATEAPPPTEAPIEEPYTQTVDGTVLAYSSYKLVYNKVWSDVTVTNTRGLGDPSTVATPVPTQTDVNHDGSDICSSSDKNVRNALGGACQETIDKFEDDTIYGGYTSRYSRMGSILKALTFGKAGCTVQFECEDYGIGMSGKLIKEARAKAKDEGMERCGNIFLSNSCKIHVDYCTNCHNDGP